MLIYRNYDCISLAKVPLYQYVEAVMFCFYSYFDVDTLLKPSDLY